MFRNYRFKNYNFRLVVFVVALTIYGILIIGSANKNYQTKQIIGMILGIIVMVVVSMIDYTALLSLHWAFYGVACTILLMVFIPGLAHSSKCATRWVRLGPIQFQPSELAKVFVVLFLAWYLMKYQDELNKKGRLFRTIILCLIPLGLIVLEPDLSTTIVTFCIIFAMLFYAGLSKKIVGAVVGLIAAGAFGVIFLTLHAGGVLQGYQNERIAAWLQPDKYPSQSMQQQNSIMAIGSGELF